MSGLELHARIKQLRPGLPCIVVTGYSSVESYLNAINSGVCEYLNKPYGNRELLRVVGAVLDKSVMIRGDGSERIL
jgi:DNA-binding NtrC family response regulator